MTFASLRRVAVEGYRRLLMPLGFVGAVLLLSVATAVIVVLPLYVAATRATIVYNIALGILLAGAVVTAVVRRLVRRARHTGDAAGYARRLVVITLWAMVRLLVGVVVVFLSLLVFRIGPAAGAAASVAALAVICLLVGSGRTGQSSGSDISPVPPPPPTAER